MSVPDISTGIKTLLDGDATLAAIVSTRIYQDSAPPGVVLPYVVMRHVETLYVGDTPTGNVEEKWQIFGYSGLSRSQAASIASAIHGALHEKTLALSGWSNYKMVVDSHIGRELDELATQFFIQGVVLRVGASETIELQAPGAVFVSWDGVDLSAGWQALSIERGSETFEVATANETASYPLQTVSSLAWSMTINRYDSAGTAVDAGTVLTMGSEGTLIFAPEGTASGKPKYEFNAVVTGIEQEFDYSANYVELVFSGFRQGTMISDYDTDPVGDVW